MKLIRILVCMFILVIYEHTNNKSPMSHIAHLINSSNQFVQSYGQTITLSVKRKKTLSTFSELNGSLFVKPKSPSTKNSLCKVWLKLSQFTYNLPLEKTRSLHLKKNWIPFTQGPFVLSFVEIGYVNHFFLWYFLLFRYYLPFEEGMTFHLSKLNPLYPRMIYAKFGWNLPSSGEEDF